MINKTDNKIKFIDFFAGIGGFRVGMEMAGHECVGFCEWDKFATASYTSMHLITDKQRKNLEGLNIKQRQKEILKEEYRNGEWYSNDIRTVKSQDIPNAECWCFGAPCQDFSIAGKRAGLSGDRSSLIREIFKLLEEQQEENRPEWIIYENVKGMFSSNRGLDYLSIVLEMDRLGYNIEWQNINSKWFVPQNRERIYTIGHFRKCGERKILLIGKCNEPADGSRREIKQIAQLYKKETNPIGSRVYDVGGISPTLGNGNAMSHPMIMVNGERIRKLTPKECFRLQGFSDEYFDRAAFVNSDNQLYKQAGNSVTVNVVNEIAKKL